MSAQTFPLQWPEGFPRTAEGRREKGLFKTSFDGAHSNVVKSLRLFGQDSGKAISAPVLSSNMDLLNRLPKDPGVALWFTWDGMSVCIPVDRYSTPAANLQAVHHIIEARRVELRHGTLALVRATFAGFKALPPPPGTGWRDVLAFPSDASVTRTMIEARHRDLAKEHHPDKGGSAEKMALINQARDRALGEIPQ